MNQPLDNFFREKLEHAHKPAPPAAWDRIDAGLDGRQHKGLWLKIAASVLIVATAAFICWPSQQGRDTQWVAKTKKSTAHPDVSGGRALEGLQSTTSGMEKHVPQSGSSQADREPAASVPDPSSPGVALHSATTPVLRHKVQKPRAATPAVADAPGKFEQDQQQVAYQDHEATLQTFTEPVHESVTPAQPAPASADVVLADAETEAENDQAITLVYTAAEINAKYLDKEALEKATSAQKKPSTFRKLLDKAYDLKNNQDPMGGLRQKKNEILALNFKSEKRSQNK